MLKYAGDLYCLLISSNSIPEINLKKRIEKRGENVKSITYLWREK